MKSITCAVERPPVPENSFSKIPFGPSIRRLKPGTIKVLAAVVRSSWVDRDTRRRVSLATYRRLAELAELADPQTIAKHLAELAEIGAISFEEDDGRRVVIVHERAEGIGDMFVSIQDSHPAWKLKPGPFVLFLAVRSFDTQNIGYSLMRNCRLAARLNWSDRAVKRAMAALRSSETVTTVSTFNQVKATKKRVVYTPNPTPNHEETLQGGYEKAVHLCEVRKSDTPHYEKVTPPTTKNCHPPLRKSGPCITNSENEFLERTVTTNQPTNGLSGQSERAETDQAEVVVVEVKTSTDTNPEPKPGAEAPPDLSEVAALLAESQLAPDEQRRYLDVTRKMDEPPPIAWHVHALDVKPSSGTKSIAGVVISRLKAWTTTPTDQRAAIVDEIAARDAEVIAKRLRSAGFWYKANLGILKADSGQITAAEVRRSWEQYNAALAAAGQPAVQLPNEVLHAEEAKRKRAAIPALTIGDMMAQHAAKREQAAALAEAEERGCKNYTPIPAPPPVDSAELERRRLARAERERAEQRSRVETDQAKEITRRVEAFDKRAMMLLSLNSPPGGLNAALDHFRTVTLPKKRAEIEAEVLAEFAPKFAALGPPPPPARARKPPGPPPGPPATIPAMASR
jgi:hypothetical protein